MVGQVVIPILAFTAIVGWEFARLFRRRLRAALAQLERYQAAEAEIDEGLEPRKPTVAFTLDPDTTQIRQVGRYRNPGRRHP